MMTLGPLAFAAPWALTALIALPFLWLLLRATPPAPQVVVFAPIRLLQRLARTPETPDATPWWLIVLRLTLAALVVLALARPVWSPTAAPTSDRPVLVIIDDGWSGAARWPALSRKARTVLEAARSDGRSAALLYAAPAPAASVLRFGPAGEALNRLAAHTPQAWPSDPAAAAARIETALETGELPARFDTIWISDGLAADGDAALAALASNRGDLTVVLPDPDDTALGLNAVAAQPDGFTARLVRADTEVARPVSVTALSVDGQALARAEATFASGRDRLEIPVRLPLDLRNRISQVQIDGEESAGAVHVTGDRWRRPRVGLISPDGGADGQPLLSDLHYVREALAGSAELVRGDLDTVLDTDPAALVLVDAARPDLDRLTGFVEQGGLLIRFAGPRLAANTDELLPVRLREGGRLFGGAMAWEAPQGLGAFADDSPFAGLAVSTEAQVTRQVLANPGPDLDSKVWARLEDGTPLVTAERRGQGWIVLFHVTAGPDWSSLPLSGLYPAMLERVLALSGGAEPAPPVGGAWGLEAMLDGAGRLVAPRADAIPLPVDQFASARASAATPPGVWTLGASSAALNVLQPADRLSLKSRTLPGAVYQIGDTAQERRLGGVLLSLALIVLALDGLITLVLAGRLPLRWTRASAPAAALLIAAGGILVPGAEAQDADDAAILERALAVRLAYVQTGDANTDALSRAALTGLSRESTRRSAVEPVEPVGVNIETDEIVFFPMLYWPVSEDAPALSEAAAARVNAYMNAGGLIVFDTRDGRTAAGGTAPHPGLVRLLEAVDVPPLQLMPDDHVLGRTFYLLSSFPGRYPDTQVWVERNPEGSARDGASSVVIGSADWASAWAVDEQGRPIAPVEGGPRQRELAIRFGVNLAMYALTGNYKADQVHVPAILERLGQD